MIVVTNRKNELSSLLNHTLVEIVYIFFKQAISELV